MTEDPRPPVWIGHVVIQACNIKAAADYWIKLGMRPIADGDGFAVLELRGGTHLVIARSDDELEEGTPCTFDLMVEDIDASHAQFEKQGLSPTAMERGDIHDSFILRDPSGYDITVNSTHVSDLPV